MRLPYAAISALCPAGFEFEIMRGRTNPDMEAGGVFLPPGEERTLAFTTVLAPLVTYLRANQDRIAKLWFRLPPGTWTDPVGSLAEAMSILSSVTTEPPEHGPGRFVLLCHRRFGSRTELGQMTHPAIARRLICAFGGHQFEMRFDRDCMRWPRHGERR